MVTADVDWHLATVQGIDHDYGFECSGGTQSVTGHPFGAADFQVIVITEALGDGLRFSPVVITRGGPVGVDVIQVTGLDSSFVDGLFHGPNGT